MNNQNCTAHKNGNSITELKMNHIFCYRFCKCVKNFDTCSSYLFVNHRRVKNKANFTFYILFIKLNIKMDKKKLSGSENRKRKEQQDASFNLVLTKTPKLQTFFQKGSY